MGSTFAPGDLIDGKYRIIRTIGEGGWGIVFEGENVRTFKRVAIKILRPHSGLTRDILTRFEREAQAAGRIGSEHIVEVYDLGSLPDGTHYMVMELLHGDELAARVRAGGPLDPVAVAKIVLQLLDGLKAAHDAGISHRDLKPENLFLVRTRSGDDFVKILDFGISKFSSNIPERSATMTGAVLGSPCYMAPEQARGLKQVDGRTDLYAVGTLMYESLTGRVPFDGDNFNDLMFKIVLAPRPDPRHIRPDLDPGMVAIVMKAMAIDPQHRFQNAEEMSAAISEWLSTQGVATVRTPELRHAGTPRTSREPSQTPDMLRPPTPAVRVAERAPPPSFDATVPAEGVQTPLVSSSSEVRMSGARAGSRKGPIAVVTAAALAVLLAAAGGVWIARGRHAVPPSAALSAPPPPVVSVSDVARATPPPIASLAPSESSSPTASLVPLPPAPSASSEIASPLPTGHRAGVGMSTRPATPATGARPGAVAAAAATPKASDAPPPPTPPPPATSAPPARPVSDVEGREIRTGL